MVRIAVLVSGGGTNLQALIDAQGRGEIPDGQIAAVISSSPDAFALERAKKAGIPGYVIDRKAFASNQAMTVALTQQLKELDEVAYVRFASVYRQFKDVQSFMEELQLLLDSQKKPQE